MRSLIVDPTPHLAEADARLLRSIDMNIEIETVSNLDDAMARTRRPMDVDLVVYAIRSGQFRSYPLIEALCHWAIGSPVAVLSLSDNLEEMLEVQRCGAAGYVPLNLRRDVLTNVLRVLFGLACIWFAQKLRERHYRRTRPADAARDVRRIRPAYAAPARGARPPCAGAEQQADCECARLVVGDDAHARGSRFPRSRGTQSATGHAPLLRGGARPVAGTATECG